jgi:hypothetical protein
MKFGLRYRTCLLAMTASIILGMSASALGSATINIQNNDPAGVGFNDPTAVTPVGGNNGTTLGQQRFNAVQFAANIWGATLTSTTTINIRAQWTALPCTANQAALASAGTISIFRDFSGATFPGTWYGEALANKLSGTDQDPGPEIDANFNVNLGSSGCFTGFPFYLGLDNNHGTNPDLVSVSLHEFSHGFGFQTFTNSTTTGAQNGGFPSVYDRFLLDNTTGLTWIQMTNSERLASAINTNHLVWTGPQVTSTIPSVLSAAGVPTLKVNSPAGIAGNYAVGLAQFGPALFSPGVTGNLIQATDPNDGAGTLTTDGCSSFTNAAAVNGKIAVIDRGTCAFVTKTLNAQSAGAIGVVVINNIAGAPGGMSGSDPSITIPTVMVSQADGTTIRNQLGGGVNGTIGVDNSTRAGADVLGRALLYTPNPVEGGSSVSHWDTSAFPNQLMEPDINDDLTHSVIAPQDLTAAMLSDVGWAIAGGTPTPSPSPSPSPNPSPGCTSGNRTQDPGFEATNGGTLANTFWPSTSTNFPTALCSVAGCGGGGDAVPRSGTFWIWFGGISAAETGVVSQTVTFPSGGTATLNYYLKIGGVSAPFNDVLNVKVDGTTVQSFTEPNTAETSYTQRSVNLDAYANGAQHTIQFQYVHPNDGAGSNFHVDDVTLDVVCPVVSTLQFSASNYNVGEGGDHAIVTVIRSGAIDVSGTVTVDFLTSDGTATQSQDYIINGGTFSFGPGESSKSFDVLIIDDAFIEGNKTLNLTLSNPTGGTLAAPSTATITINDNDLAGSISPLSKRFFAALDGAQETPANGSTARGTGTVVLNANDTSALVGLQFQNLSSAETAAHIHGASAPGVAAPILFPLPTTNPVLNFSIAPTTQQVADLRATLHYENAHSNNFPNGEIRGQLRWNPTLEDTFFVRQQYLDFLGRDPDTGGFNFWVGAISGCQANVQCFQTQSIGVSDAFFFEPEFQQTAGFVFRAYRASYGNVQPFPVVDSFNQTEANKLVDYSVYVKDRARVIGGANLATAQLAFANLFVSRPEFISKYPANLDGAQFIAAILATIQASDNVDLSGQTATLMNEFNTGGRGRVLYRLADDNAQTNPINNQAFIDAEYNRQFALTLYFGYLRHSPDIRGFLFWQDQINSAPVRNVAKQNALVCSFMTSQEYQFRFGTDAPRSNGECPP